MARLLRFRPPTRRFITSSLLLLLALQAVAASVPARAAAEGVWQNQSLPAGVYSAAAAYDPLRDQMIVFGGYTSYYSNTLTTLPLGGMTWTVPTPTGSPPEPRSGTSAIYDPDNDRIVYFGGFRPPALPPPRGSYYLSDCPTLNLSGTPSWNGLPFGPARAFHSAIYDPLRKRMVIFGGISTLSDVWALSLVGPATWTQLAPSGTPPPGRSYHTAIYDPVRDRMIVFGGTNGSVTLNDVWALSFSGTPTWTQLIPDGTSPSARYGHTAVYDPDNDCMTVFGGGDVTLSNETWTLSLSGTPTWAQVTTNGTPPFARRYHVAIRDAARHRLVVFGGLTGAGPANDTKALRLVGSPDWSALTAQGNPPVARYGHTAVFDPAGVRMIVFGGSNSSSRLNDVGSLSLTDAAPSWVPITPVGTAAPARQSHCAVYDATRQRMVVFGGEANTGNLNDTWTLALSGAPAWAHPLPAGALPAGRRGASMIYDPVRDRAVVFGGYSSTFLNDTWQLTFASPATWTQLAPTGSPPSARERHSAIYDPVRDRMLVFGGVGSGGSNNEVWELTLGATPSWTQLSPSGTAPAARNAHTSIYDSVRDRMLVFSGVSSGTLNDLHALDLSGSPAWSQISPFGPLPAARFQSSALYQPGVDRMVVFGGFGSAALGDLWSLFLSTPFTITASAGAGGAISPSGAVPAASGMNASFVISPDPGYKVADVVVDGVSIGAVPGHTIMNVQADHTIAASFVLPPPDTITATAGAGGTITPSGVVVVAWGGSQSFTIAASAGNHVANVWVDGVSVGAVTSYSFTNVTTNRTIAASFVPNSFADAGAVLASIPGTMATWADYDNDGDLDALITGGSPSVPETHLYVNGGGVFTEVATPVPGLYGADAAWGDYDRDGDLDLLICGYAMGGNLMTRVYRRDPGGLIDISAGMTGVYIGAVAWVDYDNDGDLDAYVAGGGQAQTFGAIYRNDNGAFVSVSAPGFYYGTAKWGDYDNDGDQDLLLSGNRNQVLPDYIGALYRNDGGTLTLTSVPVPANAGALVWGDFDADGNLDFAASSGNLGIFRNSGDGTFTNINAGQPGIGTNVLKWADYDNDGDLDLLVGSGASNPPPTRILRNDGGVFNDAQVGLPIYSVSAGAWGDYDSDNRLDMLLMGSLTSPAGYATRVYRNLLAPQNAVPTAPTGLTALFDGQNLIMSWDASSDAETPTASLSYNLRVGTTTGGSQIVSPMSAANGLRRLPQMGNAGERLSWTLRVPAAGPTYYWSVQAVDGAFAGGPFSAEYIRRLDVTGNAPRELSFALDSPNPGSGSVLFRLGLPERSHARIAIYDLAGREVTRLVDEDLPVGFRTVTWRRTGGSVAAGVYYARCAVGSRVIMRKIVAFE